MQQETLDNFISVNPKDVFVPDGRFRPLDKSKVKVIQDSINDQDRQLQAILVDKNLNLIDGNHRLHACINLDRPVICEIVDEHDTDRLELMEIDANLCRNELSATELENHLAERKKLYLKIFPETAKGKKNDKGTKSFTEDTADATGKSKRTIERAVRRGENASEELQKARDEKKVSTADIDKIISEHGDNHDAQKEALKDIIKQKEEGVKAKKEDVVVGSKEQELEAKVKELEAKVKELESDLEAKEAKLEKQGKSIKNYRDRIAKAKQSNPDIKI